MTIAEKIIKGELDNELNDIVDAIKMRRKANREQTVALNMITISVGDPAKLKGLTPKRLNGRKVQILKKNRKTIKCKFTDSVSDSRFPVGSIVTVPASCLEKI